MNVKLRTHSYSFIYAYILVCPTTQPRIFTGRAQFLPRQLEMEGSPEVEMKPRIEIPPNDYLNS